MRVIKNASRFRLPFVYNRISECFQWEREGVVWEYHTFEGSRRSFSRGPHLSHCGAVL